MSFNPGPLLISLLTLTTSAQGAPSGIRSDTRICGEQAALENLTGSDSLREWSPKGLQKLERLGPGSGGGGDYAPDEPATDQDVRQALRQARALVPFVLSHLESVAVEARAVGSSRVFGSKSEGVLSLKRSVFDRLFPWPRPVADVFERLQRLRIEPSEAECRDGLENEKAASAFPIESDAICMSVPLIRVHATKANVLRRVTALLLHEISHKMGVGLLAENHEDSIRLEKVINDGLPADPYSFLAPRIEELAAQTDPESGTLPAELNQAANELAGARDWSRLCFALGRLATLGPPLGLHHNHTDGYTLALVRPLLQAEEEAVQKRTAALIGYCSNEGKRPKEQAINRGGDAVLSMTAGVLREPRYHDAGILALELADLRASLAKIHAGAREARQSVLSARP